MEIPKPTEDDRQFFLGLIPDDPDVEVKPMFGNLDLRVVGEQRPEELLVVLAGLGYLHQG